MRIIITGSGGTIGTVLLRGLQERHEILGIDRSSTELHRADEQFLPLDLAYEGNTFDGIIQHTKPDALIHLAWDVREGGGGLSARLDYRTWAAHESNERMVRYVLASVTKHSIPRLIVASSVHAAIGHLGSYENPTSLHDKDQHTVLHRTKKIGISDGPAASGLYGATKVWMEETTRVAAAEARGALTAIAVRFGNVNRDNDAKHEYPLYLSHNDCVHFVERCLEAENLPPFSTFFAISENACNPFESTDTRQMLDFKPQDGTLCPFSGNRRYL